MTKIVVVLDIDQTLFNSDNRYEKEWLGSKELWLGLLFRLKNVALRNDVTLDFAIATSKDGPDDLVWEVGVSFSEYLVAIDKKTKIQYPALHHSHLHIQHEKEPKLSFLFHEDTQHDIASTILSSIQIEYLEHKSPSLKRIAEIFDIEDFSNIFLIDDKSGVLGEAKQSGFSVISAENVCVADKAQRDKNAIELVNTVEKEITKKILSLKNPSKSMFFTQIPEVFPSQKLSLKGFTGLEEFEGFDEERSLKNGFG